MTYFLTLDDVTELGIALLAAEGADFLVGDAGLLHSVLMRPQASIFGEPAYLTLSIQAAALMQSLARNHALVDGNKRMAWAATKLFLRFNGIVLRAPASETGERVVLDVAAGPRAVREIAQRLENWSTPA